MDLVETELREDFDRVRALLDAISLKYGEDFSYTIAMGSDIGGDMWAGMVSVGHANISLHECCHGLLRSIKFIDYFMDAVICQLNSGLGDEQAEIKLINEATIKVLKRKLIEKTDEYKEHKKQKEVDEAVQRLIDGVFNKKS